MEHVKTIFNGKEYKGTFQRWFDCELTNDKIGLINCDDGIQRAFLLDDIENDDDAFAMHTLDCTCYNCL